MQTSQRPVRVTPYHISGDHRVVVGANLEDTGGSDAGAAYIFERSGTTWTEVKKIAASDAASE